MYSWSHLWSSSVMQRSAGKRLVVAEFGQEAAGWRREKNRCSTLGWNASCHSQLGGFWDSSAYSVRLSSKGRFMWMRSPCLGSRATHFRALPLHQARRKGLIRGQSPKCIATPPNIATSASYTFAWCQA